MNKKNDSISKIKELYKKLRDAWKVPYKRAGIKIIGYIIFFTVFFIMAATLNNGNRDTSNGTVITSEIKEDKYTKKQDDLINLKHNINYLINIGDVQYKINGTIENGNISGYLETSDSIKKIVLEDGILYEVKNEEKNILELDIDYGLLNIKSIINKIKTTKTITEVEDDKKNFFYTIDIEDEEVNIKIYTDEKAIYRIDISKGSSKYELNFDK